MMASSTHRLSIGNVENFNQVNGGGSVAGSRRLSVTSRRSSVSNSTAGGEYTRRRRISRQSFCFHPRVSNQSKIGSATDSRPTKPIVKMENTFKMAPDEGEKFIQAPIERIIRNTLELNLKDVMYEPRTCGIYARRIAEEIKDKVREQNYRRYKVVAQVLINSKSQQSCEVVSRALWNTDTDNFAAYTYQTPSLVAIGIVHGAYYE